MQSSNTSNTSEATSSSPTSENRFPTDKNDFTTGQSQLLLTALRNLIVPLVQKAVPDSKDLCDTQMGPEAENLLVALQQYISSVIRRLPDSGIQDGTKRTVDLKDAYYHEPQEPKTPDKDTEVKEGGIHAELPDADIQNEKEALLDKALMELRAHVFNEMPIRLLCAKQEGSKIHITLLDRAGIYACLVPKLKEQFVSWRGLRSSQGSVQISAPYITSMWVSRVATFAILSHTWLRSSPGEVTYDDWQKGSFDTSHAGYQKVANFCRVAQARHGMSLCWMDTVCIDKTSSAELDESIRSMYKWYQKAQICITYLAETTTISDIPDDSWFTRGWTLQELLAPEVVKFYGNGWQPLVNTSGNDKLNPLIQRKIQLATTITSEELKAPSSVPLSRRMQWAADRKVTRGEDTAYSLMGIFNVSMSIAYGEGMEVAFMRLVKEILNTSKSETLDIFNWGGLYRTDASALIPSSPRAYLLRSKELNWQATLREPLMFTHLGLRTPVLLLPSAPARVSTQEFTPIGDYHATVRIQATFLFGQINLLRSVHNILDAQTNLYTHFDLVRHRCLSFAILNCGADEYSNVLVPRQCLSIAILHTGDAPGAVTTLECKSKVITDRPIVFQLKNKASRSIHNPTDYDTIQSSQLAYHGMRYLHMYL